MTKFSREKSVFNKNLNGTLLSILSLVLIFTCYKKSVCAFCYIAIWRFWWQLLTRSKGSNISLGIPSMCVWANWIQLNCASKSKYIFLFETIKSSRKESFNVNNVRVSYVWNCWLSDNLILNGPWVSLLIKSCEP